MKTLRPSLISQIETLQLAHESNLDRLITKPNTHKTNAFRYGNESVWLNNSTLILKLKAKIASQNKTITQQLRIVPVRTENANI